MWQLKQFLCGQQCHTCPAAGVSCSEEQQMANKMGQRPCVCRGYRNNHFASPGRCGFEFWSGMDVFVPLCIGGACLHPAHLAGPGPPVQGAGKPGNSAPWGSWAILSWHPGSGSDSSSRSAGTSHMTNSSAATCQKTPSFPPGYWEANLFYVLRQKDK